MTLDAQEARIIDIIDRVGWAVVNISPKKGDQNRRWSFTVGLPVTHGWPELICFGLQLDTMMKLLNNAVQELKRKGLSPTPNLELTEVIEGTPARLETFSPDFYREHLGWALWFAHHRGLKPENIGCLQLLWPNKNGHFSSDARCDAEVRRIQTPINASLR